jgi:transcription initiation factor IIE alpha subunit
LVLSARNIEEGCRSAKITTQTWYTWLREGGFKAEVDRQREAVISEAMDRLKAAVNEAVEGLTALMGVEEKNIRLRACERVLEYFLKTKEIEEIEQRVSELEKAIGGKRGGI